MSKNIFLFLLLIILIILAFPLAANAQDVESTAISDQCFGGEVGETCIFKVFLPDVMQNFELDESPTGFPCFGLCGDQVN